MEKDKINMLKFAHNHSIFNREEIKRSCKAGCFYCTKVFLAKSIKDWTDDDRTALCPKCGIDSMIGDASDFELTRTFLAQMNATYFGYRCELTNVLKRPPSRLRASHPRVFLASSKLDDGCATAEYHGTTKQQPEQPRLAADEA